MEGSDVAAERFGFGRALEALRGGVRVQRAGWNAHHSLELQVPDEHSKMTRPYVYMIIGDDAADMPGAKLPWVASQTDILAEDWHIVAA